VEFLVNGRIKVRVIKTTILALLCSTATALSATPGSMSQVDSNKGEVLLEVQATGVNKQKATKFLASCTLVGKGKTEALATSDLATQKDDLVKRLKARGIDRVTIDFSGLPTLAMQEDYGDAYAVSTTTADAAAGAATAAGDAATAGAAVEAAVAAVKEPEKVFALTQFLPVTLTSIKAYNDANFVISQSTCSGNEYAYMGYPRFGSAIEIADRPAAQRAAKNQALVDAKVQADAYAAAMGLKVLRLVRVSESSALKEILGPEANIYQDLWNEYRGSRGTVADEVSVSVSIWVDYVLGPK
jgi:uncharacterized protein YggE